VNQDLLVVKKMRFEVKREPYRSRHCRANTYEALDLRPGMTKFCKSGMNSSTTSTWVCSKRHQRPSSPSWRRAKFSFQQTPMATTLARSVTARSRSLTQPADATNRN